MPVRWEAFLPRPLVVSDTATQHWCTWLQTRRKTLFSAAWSFIGLFQAMRWKAASVPRGAGHFAKCWATWPSSGGANTRWNRDDSITTRRRVLLGRWPSGEDGNLYWPASLDGVMHSPRVSFVRSWHEEDSRGRTAAPSPMPMACKRLGRAGMEGFARMKIILRPSDGEFRPELPCGHFDACDASEAWY